MVALSDADVAAFDPETASFMYYKLLLSPPGSPVGADVYPMTVDATWAADSAGGGGTIQIASRNDAALTLLRIVAHLRTAIGIDEGSVTIMIVDGANAFGPCAFVAGFADANEQTRHTSATGGWAWSAGWWGGDPASKSAYTVANYEIVFGMTAGWLQTTLTTGSIPGAAISALGGGGGGGGPPVGSGQPIGTNNARGYPNIASTGAKLLEPNDEYPSMCGVTSYNIVDGHFFLKSLPTPISESITKTVQGVNDNFESKYEDISIESLVGNNDQVDVTNVAYQGEALDVITGSTISTYSALGGAKVGAMLLQGGASYHDGSANVASSTADSIIALRVNDVRPFALKGLDIYNEAEFDVTNPLRATNKSYIRHLTPESKPRIAVIESPAALIAAGGPSSVLVYYSAIDKTGEIMGGQAMQASMLSYINTPHNTNDMLSNSFSDIVALGGVPESQRPESKSGWLVVERTVPDANTEFYDGTTPRPLSDWLRKPYLTASPSTTYDPIVIQAPGGIISLPSKDIDSSIKTHSLKVNPTGDKTQAPFINIEQTPYAQMMKIKQQIDKAQVGTRSVTQAYGLPVAVPNTRSPVKESRGAYHMLNMEIDGKRSLVTSTSDNANFSPLALEQFDIIDNEIKSDRHYILIQPKDRSRTNTLRYFTKKQGRSHYTKCRLEMILMRGRIEEIAPTSGEDGQGQGVALRGRSVLMDVGDSVVERDLDISEGYPMKEIGDIGSPVVSLTMGGLGQGGIDIKPTREEHNILPGWKDTIIGTGNPSVRNDKQASTYYASTRALVEIPLFPSMFYDVEKRLESSINKRSPLPSDKSMEMVVDCSMMAVNRPQMQDYESRYAIDWGLRSEVSSVKVHDYSAATGGFTIRCMRENAATFTKPSAGWSANEDTVVVSSSDNWKTGGAYIEVDSVLPFVQEGGWPASSPSSGGAYAGNGTAKLFQKNEVGGALPYTGGNAIWDFTLGGAGPASPNGKNGFIVTVGEGICGEMGIRLHIHKMEISGTSHRLYFARFSNPLLATTSWDEDNASWIGHFITSGLPVVMGGWLTQSNYNPLEATTPAIGGSPITSPLSPDLYISSTSNAGMLQLIGDRIEILFGMKANSTNSTRVIYDPDDSNTLLIHNGPSMEGFTVDPNNHMWGSDDKPLRLPVEVKASHFGLKGKKNDNLTLDYVRPQKIEMGSIATIKSNFKDAVDELIRQINQAGHPDALNANGGSAFNPPSLFTGNAGNAGTRNWTETSTDTGSHMGYVRAFIGGDVESRNGEGGTSIVIHSTIPGASSRNFAIWFNNNSPYGYRPIQAVGFGGLLASNSRSYQLNSFAAPLPLGADGETHVPITTFQGAVHGGVELNNELRLYDGIGQELIFNTVKHPREEDTGAAAGNDIEPALPDYDPDSQPTLWVERKALDIQPRINRKISNANPGLLLVDGKHLATFTGIQTYTASLGDRPAKQSGVGACCGLKNVQSLNPKLKDKLKSVFYGKDGQFQRVEIQLLNPLLDAHGILFFGGGHTGVTFDISDGTDNDYSDFYTHHYAKGPTGYSGLQNLQEIQTSAAVLDLTEVKNEDTAKDNSYAGMHYKDDNCIMYLRLNKFAARYISDHDGYTPSVIYDATADLPIWKPVENKFGMPLGLVGNWSNELNGVGDLQKGENHDNAITDQSVKPLYVSASNHGDISARGVLFNDAQSDDQGIVLTKIADKAALTLDVQHQSLDHAPPDAGGLRAEGPWSVTFCTKPSSSATDWAGASHGSGPVIHGIDQNGKPWGVSFYTRNHDLGSGANNTGFNFRVVVHHTDTASAGNIQASYTSFSNQGYNLKNTWMQVTVVKPLDAAPLLYIKSGGHTGVVALTTKADELYPGNAYPMNDDATYETLAGHAAGFKHPKVMPAVGLGRNASANTNYTGGYRGRHRNLITIANALHGVPTVTDAAFNNGAGATVKLTHQHSMVGNTYPLKYGWGGSSEGTDSALNINFRGYLAEIGLWNKALSATEAATIIAMNWD